MQNQFNTTLTRSRNMRAIKSRNNRTTERRLRAYLAQMGIKGWRVRPANLVGRPDFVFSVRRIALFTDGCFWHGCPRCGHIPHTNRAYWKAKIARNKKRDSKIARALRNLGYRVTRVWECQLREDPNRCIRRVLRDPNVGQ